MPDIGTCKYNNSRIVYEFSLLEEFINEIQYQRNIITVMSL
jgi:hypothetical protein